MFPSRRPRLGLLRPSWVPSPLPRYLRWHMSCGGDGVLLRDRHPFSTSYLLYAPNPTSAASRASLRVGLRASYRASRKVEICLLVTLGAWSDADSCQCRECECRGRQRRKRVMELGGVLVEREA